MRKLIVSLAAVVAMFWACTQKAPSMAFLNGFTQGTVYHIALKTADTLRVQRQLDSVLTTVDNSMSIFNDSSLLSRLNRNQTDSLDALIMRCIDVAGEIFHLSGGLYDITVMPLTKAWGFAAQEQRGEPNLDSLLQFVGFNKISISNGRLRKADPRVQLDLNSIAKGYTSDLVGELMERRGIRDCLVEIGGEIVARGTNAEGKPWRIGIDRPFDGNFIPGNDMQVVLTVTDMAVATSGNYRRFHTDAAGNRVVHTINPLTGRAAASNMLSATAIAPTCILADACATMFMAMGAERSIKWLEGRSDVAGYLVYRDDDGKTAVWYSPKLKKIIETP